MYGAGPDLCRNKFAPAAIVVAAGVAILLISPALLSQSSDPANKQQFEVVSVRENKTGETPYSNFPLGPGPQFDAKGGLLMARDQLLLQYIVFAYKPDMFQIKEFRVKLPDWAQTARFDIEARTDGNPTKDEMRLMMQSLLAERFHLVAHTVTHADPVYAVVLAKPGATGPQLKPHPANDPSCAAVVFPKAVAGAYAPGCGASASIAPQMTGDTAIAGYNVAPDAIATAIGGFANITDRRFIDQTELTGTFDFKIEFAPEQAITAASEAASDLVPVGPSLADALKSQLGFKVVSQKKQVEVIEIDHLEKPSEN
jgi:uncharacterized protein (TIGR03435 family)